VEKASQKLWLCVVRRLFSRTAIYGYGRESFCLSRFNFFVLGLAVQYLVRELARSTRAEAQKGHHAGYPLEGRTPLILACLLIARGYSAKKVLAKVNAFWLKTLPFLVCSPLSDAQEKFVLEWSTGPRG